MFVLTTVLAYLATMLAVSSVAFLITTAVSRTLGLACAPVRMGDIARGMAVNATAVWGSARNALSAAPRAANGR